MRGFVKHRTKSDLITQINTKTVTASMRKSQKWFIMVMSLKNKVVSMTSKGYKSEQRNFFRKIDNERKTKANF